MNAYGCWVGGCSTVAQYQVRNPATRLVEPVESCSAHVGDLLGNVAKSALAPVLETHTVTVEVTRLD